MAGIRSVADHVRDRGHEPCVPTTRMLKHWWSSFNREVFDNELLPCQLGTEPYDGHRTMGYCTPLASGRARIDVVPEFQDSRASVLATLLHEMVHQVQHQRGGAMNHGPTFTAWSRHIRRITGLTI